MDQQIARVHADVERLEGDLTRLGDLLWQSIDHRDRAARDAGLTLFARVEGQQAALSTLRTEIVALPATLGQDHSRPIAPVTAARPNAEPPAQTGPPGACRHALDEDFTHTKPAAICLGGQVFAVSSWRDALQTVTRHLVRQDPSRILRLLEDSRFVTKHGRHLVARRPDGLDEPIPISEGLFFEGKLRATSVAQFLVRVLAACGGGQDACGVRLQSDPAPPEA